LSDDRFVIKPYPTRSSRRNASTGLRRRDKASREANARACRWQEAIARFIGESGDTRLQ